MSGRDLETKLTKERSVLADELSIDEHRRMFFDRLESDGADEEEAELDAVDEAMLLESGAKLKSWVGKSSLEGLRVAAEDESKMRVAFSRGVEEESALHEENMRLAARRDPRAPRTGAKSVLEDKRVADMDRVIERDRKALQWRRKLELLGGRGEEVGERRVEEMRGGGEEGGEGDGEEEDEDEEEEEEDFMREYRRKRMEELKKLASEREVVVLESKDAFLEFTNEPSLSLVHLSDEIVPLCRSVDAVLPKVAALLPTIRFATAPCSIIAPTFDPIALPTLILYSKGDTLNSIVALGTLLKDPSTIDPTEIAQIIKNNL